MSSILSAELAATCSALGYYDAKSNKYYADSNTLETVKDLIRYLRRDDETHDIRRQLGNINVLQNDLIPLLRSYWEETELFDVLLRLMVNLTTPALMLWNEEVPTDKITRNHFMQVEDHLKCYKQSFADESFWAVLSTRISKILEIDFAERGEENSLIIERILILIRNILYVPPDPTTEKRTHNDASVHDQVLWALHQSGMLDILLYMSSATNEKAYYMHILEILSHLLREQTASGLAHAALQRSETEKIRDEAELLAIRHRETMQKHQKIKMFNGSRHSRFGGTYVLKSMKSISDNEFIYHKPLNKLESLSFDSDKSRVKIRKNLVPVVTTTFERRSAFSIRLFLKEFCVEFLNGAYNTLMYHVKDNLVRARAQAHDESYYLWALSFFMEFNRCYKFEVKLVSETMSVRTFHYVQQLMDSYFDGIQTDKKKFTLWSRRLHIALLAYRELLFTICAMDKSTDATVRDSANVIKSNLFYTADYRELIITLLHCYNELIMSDAYLRDLIETQHIFLKMFEKFCGTDSSVIIQKKSKKKRKNKKASQTTVTTHPEIDFESKWDELAPQLSTVLEGYTAILEDVVPFDAASDVPIDEQKSEAMNNVQRKLRSGEFENAINLLRAAREVWPENNCFGSNNMAPEEEFSALRDIFFADLGENDRLSVIEEQPIYDENNDEEEGDEEDDNFVEGTFEFKDFTKRLVHPKIVRACGLALREFQTNSVNTNHCILKLLHRIAFDCQSYVMVFQVSIFQTFQKIFANKEFPQYRELVKFATFIIRKFIKTTEVNNKVYMECLFWTNTNDAYDIEHGYNSLKKSAPSGAAWSEEEEDELRRLFMEHQENQLEDDLVDWIVNNLIDNTRSRHGVLRKLKEMCLLVTNLPRTAKVSRQWKEEEEDQLRELFEEFKDAVDPIGCIIPRLERSASKPAIIQKLLDLGLIENRAEVRKKRTKSSTARRSTANGRRSANSNIDSNISDNDDNNLSDDAGPSTSSSTVRRTSNRKQKKPISKRKNASNPISDGQITKCLLKLVESGLEEALEWLKESFSDAVEDFNDDDETCEGIPLVPIMDYAVNAMENKDFLDGLKGLGVCPPADEQEMYWRIPGHLSVEVLKNYIVLIEKAIDHSLVEEENDTPVTVFSNVVTQSTFRSLIDSDSEDENVASGSQRSLHVERNPQAETHGVADILKAKKKGRIILESDDDNEESIESSSEEVRLIDENLETYGSSNLEINKKTRMILESDDEENETTLLNTVDANDESKRNRNESDSETEKPKSKRTRVISSSEDE